MAAVDTGNNPNDPNNPNNQPGNVNQPGQQQTNQPATTGGAGGVTTTGSGNVTGQVVGTANPSQPFQNISSYLAANVPGGQQLAGQVANTVSQPITEAQTGITNAANTFTQSVNSGYTPENKDLITAVSENPAYVTAENPNNVNNFLGQLNDTYTGPTDFTQAPGYANLQSQIANAQAQAANTQSESGIQTLLGSVEGPTTAGINKLDSLLLSADPANYQTIQNAGVGAANLLPTLNQTTTDQNALAATGATNASQSAADALAALATAQGTEGTNLTNEQNSIESLVNNYNQSVGVVNPVVSDISSAIQNFLANNPNITFGGGPDPLADLRNLASIVMPQEAAYASPQDYAQIAALTQLGDTNVGNLPITSATADQAQTFQLPTQLMDALGKAPAVESALQNEVGGFGNEINNAVKPFTDAETAAYNWGTYGQPAQNTMENDEQQIAQETSNLSAMMNNDGDPASIKATQDNIAALQADDQKQQAILAANPPASWDAVAPIAQGLQWVNGTETSYQQLIDTINSELGKLGNVGIPNLTYGPNTVAPNVPGAPIGVDQAAKLASIGTQIGAPVAAGLGGGAAAANAVEAANIAQGGFGEGLATSGAEGAETTAENMAGLQAGLNAVAPAALAAYGASNIVKNASANPIKAGLGTLANTGISLATLSLPPQIFKSIGKDITNVINSIGDFFGNLF